MLFYLNPDFKLEINSFKRIDKMGMNHFSLFSSILKPSTLKLSCSNYTVLQAIIFYCNISSLNVIVGVC